MFEGWSRRIRSILPGRGKAVDNDEDGALVDIDGQENSVAGSLLFSTSPLSPRTNSFRQGSPPPLQTINSASRLEIGASQKALTHSASDTERNESVDVNPQQPQQQQQQNQDARVNLAELLDGENAYPLICGVLAVKVVSAEIREERSKDCFVFSRLKVRNITKYTENASRWGEKFTWGEMTYFPIRIVRNPRHPFNLFQVDIFSVPHYVPFAAATKETRYIIGSVPFHVHDLVKGAPSAGSFTLLKGHRPVGNVSLEIYFTYGAYGYGYSPQFKDAETAANLVRFSMLPRSIPKTKDPWSQTLVVSAQKTNSRILDEKEHAKEFPLVHSRMKRLEHLKDQYNQIDPRDRMEKLSFLYRQINHSSTKQSLSAPPVFLENNSAISRDPSFFQKYMRPTLPK